MRFLLRIIRFKGYRVSLDKTENRFLYREQGRSLHVSGEAMADGYAVYTSSIRHWENTPAEVINDQDRLRIAANIRSYLVDRGQNVYIS